MEKPRTEIQSFYKDKIIFITGASGFMGKVLLEKLLYDCSDVDKIYILIRPKKGLSIELRMDNMWKLPVRHLANYAPPYLGFGSVCSMSDKRSYIVLLCSIGNVRRFETNER